ncbi:CHAT domain-containing protein [Mesorhizobium mediterraneum]|uniref:CHAT domain-containing protein n=1 Tax=Mesorhizobium mediterraneum TaxID=43617 RepID=UPI0017870816|nr:CHAT domain-containing protein [Mesorhizobium mediterraneum]
MAADERGGGKASIVVQSRLGFLGATAVFKIDGETRWSANLAKWFHWQGPDMDLWLPDLARRIDQLGARDGFFEKLGKLVVNQRDDRALLISGGRAADSIPWEALVDRNYIIDELRDRYVPVRSPTEAVLPAGPNPCGAPRILLLVGEGGSDFDAAEYRDRLVTMLSQRLGSSRKGIVLESAFLTDNLAALVEDEVPHVVVVFAHGQSNPSPAVKTGQNAWLNVGDLADTLTRSSICPPHWVFISCSVGENASSDDLARFPAAYSELAKRGIATMVAMRSRIRPEVGEAILLEFIERVLAGEPIARACAMARHAVRSSGLADGRWDWAAPAVWAGSVAEDPIIWTDDEASLRLHQCHGLRVLRAGARDEAIGLRGPAPAHIDRANAWIGHKRVVVRNETSSSEALEASLFAICAAARTGHTKTIVPIIPLATKESYSSRLIGWARSVRGQLSLTADDKEYAIAIEVLARGDVHEGLGRLMALPNAFVVFVEAPGQGISDKAIWSTLKDAPAETVIVVCGAHIDASELEGEWVADMVHAVDDMPRLAANALERAPTSMRFWAVLRRPASPSIIAKLAGEPQERSHESGILVEDSGCRAVLADSARQEIRRLLGANGIKEALDTYIKRRAESSLSGLRSDPLEELRLFVEAKRHDEAVLLSTALCDADSHYWSGSEWLAFAAVVDQYKIIQRLPSWIRLRVAYAYFGRQVLDEVEGWLQDFLAGSSEERARCDMMLSEVSKGRGRIESMWSYAHSAVKALRDDAENIDQNLLATFEMNLARLDLYFNKNAAAACREFERLLTQIGYPADAGAAETYAALKRNLAEGLFEFEAFGQVKDVKAARRHLYEGIDAAKHFELLALASECAYSLAKLEESVGTPNVAISELDRCAELAIEAKHPLVHRIARLRQYRVRVQYQGHTFDDAAFRSLIRPLDAMIDHAWAARYTAQSRNWAAKRGYEMGEYDLAAGYLHDVVSIAREIPGLSTAADLLTLVTAYSGLRAMAHKRGSAFDWDGFATRPDVAEWLAVRKINPERLWAEGI